MNPKSLILASVLLSGVAQVCLKQGMNRVQQRGRKGLAGIALSVLQERFVWIWGSCFVLATCLWLIGLQKVDLSYAYPLVSLGYVLVSLLAILFFKEKVEGGRWLAILMICAGVVMIAGS
ncbi:MAG TPA: EamA family transporter [Alphaproteobacteria bacterium]|nr:EamA family transporter [Alphaproteobacteria bacterium]